jgi:hypothetical protein
MRVVADTHVHLYSCYDLAAAFAGLGRRLADLAPGAVRVACLTERAECHFFRDLRQGKLDRARIGGDVTPLVEPGALTVGANGDSRLFLLAGRQSVTAERIEVLALAADMDVPDGLPAEDAIGRIRDAGGVPVIGWALGKWAFARGRVVAALLEKNKPGTVLVGDTSMRPALWPEPGLMRAAREVGYGVLAGSDPLPFAGEERRMGCYASLLEGDFDPERPVASLHRMLCDTGRSFRRVGRRCNFLTVALRLRGNARTRSR